MRVIPNIDRDRAAVWFCADCRDDIRIIPAGGEPANGCMRCGGVAWEQFADDESAEFFDTRFGSARVYFCARDGCRKPVVYWNGADVARPCVACGSRAFEELVGPNARIWLREHGGQFA